MLRLQEAHSKHLLFPGCGRHIPNKKYYSSWGTNKSNDTPFGPVTASQGLQEAHGGHLLVPGAGAVGGTSQPIKFYSSWGPNKSNDTPFVPLSASQGLQEAHERHLLVPGVGAVGQTMM